MELLDFQDPRIQSAFVGSLAALITVILKEFAIFFWKESRDERKSELAIYRNYADPLLSSAIDLFWRLREALTRPSRGAYLATGGNENLFEKYKFESTLYRLAALIAWIRAFRRELTFLSLGRGDELRFLKEAITKFETALADGAHVESERIRRLSEVWQIELPTDSNELSKLAVDVEQTLKRLTPPSDKDQDLLVDSEEAVQKMVCKEVSALMQAASQGEPLGDELIKETLDQAVPSLSMREAWIYRDFQSGIGDLMITEIQGASRRFDVLGFKEFEALLRSGDEESERWINRISRVFDGVDVSKPDEFDARVGMLEETLFACMDLVTALVAIDDRRTTSAHETIKSIRGLRADQSWRKTTRVETT